MWLSEQYPWQQVPILLQSPASLSHPLQQPRSSVQLLPESKHRTHVFVVGSHAPLQHWTLSPQASPLFLHKQIVPVQTPLQHWLLTVQGSAISLHAFTETQ